MIAACAYLHLSHTFTGQSRSYHRLQHEVSICFATQRFRIRHEPARRVVKMMQGPPQQPSPWLARAIQFAEGADHLSAVRDVVKKAKEMGFAQIQVATNGRYVRQ